ncbi:ATP-binding protein [Methylobacterium sp. A54F]
MAWTAPGAAPGTAQDGAPSRLFRILLAGAGILLAAILVIAAVLIIKGLRDKELADARRELMTLDTVLAEETARAMQSVDLVLTSAIEGLGLDEAAPGADFARLVSGREVHDNLKVRVAGIPQLDAVSVVGADGRVLNFSRYYPVPDINLGDRDYFAYLRDTPVQEPYITEPVENRGNGTWTIYLARRLTGPDGRFAGLVLGAINLSYFDNFYRSLNLGGQSAVSLWRRDGTLLTREPAVPGVGRRFKIKAFAPEILSKPAGFYEIADSMDGARRLVATRTIQGYPLVINVTRTRDEVLHDWRYEAMLGAGATLLCLVALLLLLWALGRQSRANLARAAAIAEREEAVRAREVAEAQLRQSQKMEVLGQLTGGVAHDFNNMLNIILVNLEMVEAQIPEGKARTRVQNALAGAQRAAATTHKLLAFARAQPLSPVMIDVNALITDFSELLRTTMGGRARLEFVLAPNLPRLCIDPNQLENTILNLTVNARDAMPDGGTLTLSTHLAAGEGQPSLVVAASDTGVGMSEQVLARAFEPFFTTKPEGKGTGLGLSQILGFVQQSGGTVDIRSAPGAGTTVMLVFPVQPAGAASLAA